jgi:imidazoleglycerol-phosphate dehydratase/histidinol-phosphatase
MLGILKGEGVVFDDFLIDEHFPADNSPFRKPGTGMFGKYVGNPEYDLAGSWVIGDRDTDAQLAKNLGTGFLRVEGPDSWAQIAEALRSTVRRGQVSRKTKETDIQVVIDLDGKGPYGIDTGLKFFDHMLDQIAHHSGASLLVKCKGDLEVDEHHTMEDVAIALGEAIATALGDKRGIGRYGFALPMDESRALVLLDFGGRAELVWDVQFTREYVGDVPTEMFHHFFKSLSNAMQANLYIQARGENNHHLAEGIFKAFARTLKQAVRRNPFSYDLPSSKGLL